MPNDHLAKILRRADSRRKWREDRRTAERILQQRRERYANDQHYRELIKDSVRRRRDDQQPSAKKRSFNRDKLLVIDGISVVLFSSGKMAKLLAVSSRTISNWERQAHIPINHAKDRLGRRWYPSEFVTFMAEQVTLRNNKPLDEWSSQVKQAWQKLQLGDRKVPIVHDYCV